MTQTTAIGQIQDFVRMMEKTFGVDCPKNRYEIAVQIWRAKLESERNEIEEDRNLELTERNRIEEKRNEILKSAFVVTQLAPSALEK